MTFYKLSDEIRKCTRCNLHCGIREYVPGILGSKQPKIVFIGEAPGAMEDITGEPFKGRSGAILTDVVLKKMGLTRGEYTILNSVKCRPPENRDPSIREKNACRPWLMEQLRTIRPWVIVTLGRHGASALFGEDRTLGELREYYYKVDGHECYVVPTYHPMATAYVKARRIDFEYDLGLIMQETYKGVRRNGRCSLPLDAPQSLDGGGVALP